jgi:hypothetical protein
MTDKRQHIINVLRDAVKSGDGSISNLNRLADLIDGLDAKKPIKPKEVQEEVKEKKKLDFSTFIKKDKEG